MVITIKYIRRSFHIYHLLASVNWKFGAFFFFLPLLAFRYPLLNHWFLVLYHHQYLHGHYFILFLLFVVVLPYTTFPIPFFSPYSFPHHTGTALKRLKKKKKKRKNWGLYSVNFPIYENGISLHLFSFVEYFSSAYHVSNSSLKALIILDKSFFVSFSRILIFFYKYFLHFVMSLSIHFKFCCYNERHKIFHYFFLIG